MRKAIKFLRKVIVGVMLALLLIVVAIPMAVFLSFCKKESRDKFTSGVKGCVMDVMLYLSEE